MDRRWMDPSGYDRRDPSAPPMDTITVQLPAELADSIEDRARATGWPPNRFVWNMVLREVRDEMLREDPSMRGDCGAHVCRECGQEWGDHDRA